MASNQESHRGSGQPHGGLESSANSSSSWQERARDFLQELSGVKDDMASRSWNSGAASGILDHEDAQESSGSAVAGNPYPEWSVRSVHSQVSVANGITRTEFPQAVVLHTEITQERLQTLLEMERTMTLLNGENTKLRHDLHSKEKGHLQMENDLLAVMSKWREKVAHFEEAFKSMGISHQEEVASLKKTIASMYSEEFVERLRMALADSQTKAGVPTNLAARIEELGLELRQAHQTSDKLQHELDVSESKCRELMRANNDLEDKLRMTNDTLHAELEASETRCHDLLAANGELEAKLRLSAKALAEAQKNGDKGDCKTCVEELPELYAESTRLREETSKWKRMHEQARKQHEKENTALHHQISAMTIEVRQSRETVVALIHEFQLDHADHERQMKGTRMEILQLKEQLQTTEGRAETLAQHAADLQDKFDHQKEAVDVVNTTADISANDTALASRSVSWHPGTRDPEQTELVAALEKEVEYLKKKLGFMQGEVERTASGLESARREKSMASGSMRASERKMTLLQQQSSSSRRLLDAAKEAEGLLQEERKEELLRTNSRLQSSIDEIERLKAEGEAKEAAGREAAHSANLYKQQLDQSRQQNAKLQAQVEQMRRDHATEMDAMQHKLIDVQASLNTANKNSTAAPDAFTRLPSTKETESWKLKCKQLEQKLKHEKEELESAKRQFADSEESLQQALHEKSKAEDNTSRLQLKLQEEHQLTASAQKDAEQARYEAAEIRAKLTQMYLDGNAYQETIQNLQQQIVMLHEQLHTAEEELVDANDKFQEALRTVETERARSREAELELEHAAEQLEDYLETHESVLSLVTEKGNELQSVLASGRHEIRETARELARLRALLQQAQDGSHVGIEQLRAELERARAELDREKANRQATAKELAQNQADLSAQTQAAKLARESEEKFRSLLEKVKVELLNAEHELHSKTDIISRLETRLAAALHVNGSASKQTQDLNALLLSAIQETQETKTDLERVGSSGSVREHELKLALERATARAMSAETRQEEQAGRLSQLEEERRVMLHSIKSLQGQHQEDVDAIADLKAQLSQAKSLQGSHQEDLNMIASLQAQLTQAKEARIQLERELDSSQTQYEEAMREREQLRGMLATSERDAGELRSRITELESKQQEGDGARRALEMENGELKSRLQTLERKVDALERERETAGKEVERHRRTAEEESVRVREAEGRLANVSQDLLDMRERMAQAEATIKALRTELAEMQQRMDALKASSHQGDGIMKSLTGEASRLGALMKDLEIQLRNEQERRLDVQRELERALEKTVVAERWRSENEVRLKQLERDLDEERNARRELEASLRQELEVALRELASVRKELDETLRDRQRVQSTLANVEREVSERRGRMIELESQVQDVEGRRRTLESENGELKGRLLGLEARVDSLERERENTRKELERLRGAEQEAAMEVSRSGARARDAETALDTSKKEVQSLTLNLERSEASLRQMRDAADGYERRVKGFTEEVNQLETSTRANKAEIDRLNLLVLDLESRLNREKESSEKLQFSLARATEKEAAAERWRSDNTPRLGQLEKDVDSEQQARRSVEERLANLQQELDGAKRGRLELEGRVAQLERELAAEKARLQSVEAQSSSARQDLETSNRERQRLQASLDDAKREAADQRSRALGLETSMAEMRSRILDLESQVQEVEGRRRSSEEENKVLKTRLLALEGRVEALEKERDGSRGELERVRRAEQEAVSEVAKEARRAKAAEEELEKTGSQAASLKSLVEKGTSSIRSLEIEVAFLREGRGRDMHALEKCRSMLDESSEFVRHLHALVVGEGSLEWQLRNLFHRLEAVIKEKSLLEEQVLAVNLRHDALADELTRLQSIRRDGEAEVAQLTNRITSFESENGALGLEVRRLVKENSDAMGRIRELQSMLQVARETSTHDTQSQLALFERLRKEHAGLQAKFEELDAEYCKLQGMHNKDSTSLRECTHALDLSQQNVSQLHRDAERLDASLQDMIARAKEYKLETESHDRRNAEQVTALQQTIRSMKLAHSADDETMEALRLQLRESEFALVAAKKEGERSKEKSTALQRTVQSMQVEQDEQVDTIAQLRSQLLSSESAHTATKQEAEREKQEGMEQNASLQRTILSMQAVHQDNVHTIEILRKQLHTIGSAHAAAIDEVERLTLRLSQLEKDVGSEQQTRCSAEGRLATLQEEMDDAKRGRAELESTVAQLTRELAAEKEGRKQVEVKAGLARQELECASREQQRLLSERERDATALKELQTKFLKSEQRFAEVEMEDGDLRRRLKASEMKVEVLDKEKESMKTELVGMKKRLEDVGMELASTEAKRKGVEERLDIASQELKTSLADAMDTKAKLRTKEVQVDELTGEVSEKQRKITELLASGQQQDETMNSLIEELSRLGPKVRDLEAQLKRERERAEDLQVSLGKAMDKVLAAEKWRAAHEPRASQLEKDLHQETGLRRGLEEQLEARQSELKKAKQELNRMPEILSSAEAEALARRQRLEEMELKLEQECSKRRAAEIERDELKKRLEMQEIRRRDLEKELQEKTTEVLRLRTAADEAAAEVATSAAEMNNLQNMYIARARELEAELAALHTAKELLSGSLAQAQQECSGLSAENAELRALLSQWEIAHAELETTSTRVQRDIALLQQIVTGRLAKERTQRKELAAHLEKDKRILSAAEVAGQELESALISLQGEYRILATEAEDRGQRIEFLEAELLHCSHSLAKARYFVCTGREQQWLKNVALRALLWWRTNGRLARHKRHAIRSAGRQCLQKSVSVWKHRLLSRKRLANTTMVRKSKLLASFFHQWLVIYPVKQQITKRVREQTESIIEELKAQHLSQTKLLEYALAEKESQMQDQREELHGRIRQVTLDAEEERRVLQATHSTEIGTLKAAHRSLAHKLRSQLAELSKEFIEADWEFRQLALDSAESLQNVRLQYEQQLQKLQTELDAARRQIESMGAAAAQVAREHEALQTSHQELRTQLRSLRLRLDQQALDMNRACPECAAKTDEIRRLEECVKETQDTVSDLKRDLRLESQRCETLQCALDEAKHQLAMARAAQFDAVMRLNETLETVDVQSTILQRDVGTLHEKFQKRIDLADRRWQLSERKQRADLERFEQLKLDLRVALEAVRIMHDIFCGDQAVSILDSGLQSPLQLKFGKQMELELDFSLDAKDAASLGRVTQQVGEALNVSKMFQATMRELKADLAERTAQLQQAQQEVCAKQAELKTCDAEMEALLKASHADMEALRTQLGENTERSQMEKREVQCALQSEQAKAKMLEAELAALELKATACAQKDSEHLSTITELNAESDTLREQVATLSKQLELATIDLEAEANATSKFTACFLDISNRLQKDAEESSNY